MSKNYNSSGCMSLHSTGYSLQNKMFKISEKSDGVDITEFL